MFFSFLPSGYSFRLRYTEKIWYDYRTKEGFVDLKRVSWLRYETLKKSFPDRDNDFERVLGFYETFLRVSISLQKWFGMAPFFSVYCGGRLFTISHAFYSIYI
jgi:hypothetical protein